MNHQVGASGIHQANNKFKLGVSAGAKATQQNSHCTPMSAASCLSGGGVGE